MNSFKLSTMFVTLIGASLMGKLTSAKDFKSSAREPRFISFNSDGGKIDIDLDLSIPFLSIPLDSEENSDGVRGPLLNVNTKAITIAGLMAAITAFIVPLFFKNPPGQHFRLDDDFGFEQMGNTINEFILGNNYVTPCVQRAVCTLVAKTTRSNNPTSTEKIIDGLTSYKWFEEITNGTSIQEAISKGHEKNSDCSSVYKGCSMPAKIIGNLLDQFGDFSITKIPLFAL